jgi:two-component SAPR family response regulator
MPQPLTQQDQVKSSFIIEADPKSSSIELFGGFQVMDKSGADITHKFTATLKELFIFILIHSVKFEKGVSTTVLHEVFWPDKDEVSARNNRNVNLKKLRNLLQEIGNIAIENTNSYVRLILDDAVFCDYQTARRILNGGKIDRQIVEVLLKYVRRGSLLPNIQASWLDSFKSEISNNIIDTLLEYSGELDMDSDDKLLLDIADSIFNYDPINQEAMVLKCSVLNKKGKHSLAKNCYDHFAKEYLKLYGEHYPRTFEDVVSMTDHVSPHTKFE